MAAIDPLAERRKEAQQAMEGEEHAKLRAAKQAELQKQRELARRAMEGEERRKRREAKEKLDLKKQRERETKEAAARSESEAKQKAELEAAKAKKEEEDQTKASKTRRVESIEESESFINQLKTKALNLSPLRTFKTDMARAVKEEGVSISKIAISEQARRKLGQVETDKKPKSNRPIILISILILVVLSAGTYWWFFIKDETTTTPIEQPTSASLIFTETSRALELKGVVDGIRASINNEANISLPPKEIKHIYFTRNGVVQPWNSFRKIWELKIPDQLTRNLSAQFMFGVFNDGSANNRLLILKTPDFPLAFRGLLDWENTMAEDLLPLLRGINATAKEKAPPFIDKMIQNKDTRILKTIDGQTVIVYAFLDQNTIIITPNETTFAEVLIRYKNGVNPKSLAQ